MIKKSTIALFYSVLIFVGYNANASIVINSTRIILRQDKNETVTQLSNKGTTPLLAQIWIDDGDANANPSTIKLPFSVTPPVVRVDPGKGQAIRILAVNPHFPIDRESIFWFNVMEIPPAATMTEQQNFIQVAVRTRIKLFYRPASLPISPTLAYERLGFELKHANSGAASYKIVIKNPSPYFITFNYLALQFSKHENMQISLNNPENRMISPFAEMSIDVPALKNSPPANTRVSFATVNDSGGITRQETALTQQ